MKENQENIIASSSSGSNDPNKELNLRHIRYHTDNLSVWSKW